MAEIQEIVEASGNQACTARSRNFQNSSPWPLCERGDLLIYCVAALLFFCEEVVS